ncbi:HD-GYP domain-containing protein [Desulfocucumis palustris]|uniref:HD-GYP domain-containing protein n=1 Tax=Desulfocucumis palustris TaxID=1898651 RepID=UPI000CEA6C8E|nr:HD-GYP domain-containing protein [Desulfocucumis palustris]
MEYYKNMEESLRNHCIKVSYISAGIIKGKNNLLIAGLYHDIGKTKVPSIILNKNGPLSQEEFTVTKNHSYDGSQMLLEMGYCDEVVKAVLCHHERWDGEGYPLGLKGKKIPLYSRVLAVADTFDAITSDRPYRKALPAYAAIEEIVENAGRQFDPDVVELFLKYWLKHGNEYRRVFLKDE